MTTLLHISDTHFGTEVPRAMDALLRLARAHPPDVLVVSGDVTQRARAHQFEAARQFIDLIGARHVLVIAGNHDIPLFDLPRRLFAPYAGFRRVFGDALEPHLALPTLRVAGVHTARAWRHTVGHVHSSQVRASAAWLAEGAPQALRIVVAHHPAAVPDQQDSPQQLRGADLALQHWAQSGVHLVLGGHIHRPYFLPIDTATPGQHRLWIAQAGTAVSHRVRAPYPHSVNLLRDTGVARWLMQRWDLLPSATDFALCESLGITTDAAASLSPQTDRQ